MCQSEQQRVLGEWHVGKTRQTEISKDGRASGVMVENINNRSFALGAKIVHRKARCSGYSFFEADNCVNRCSESITPRDLRQMAGRYLLKLCIISEK